MVLKAVDELSDEEAAPERTPVPTKGKAMKRPAATMDKGGSPAKKLATSPDAAPKAKAKAKNTVKRPAAKLSVTRNFYKASGRYGFKINGSEKMYATRLQEGFTMHL